MVSYKNLFLIKGMTCWNWISDKARRVVSRVTSIYNGICNWFHPESASWYLYPNTMFPVPYSHYYSLGTSSWKYQPDTKQLIYLPKERSTGEMPSIHHIPWLSARSSTSDKTKDMDGFLQDLRIVTIKSQQTVPPMVLLQAWSLYDEQWWSGNTEVRLEWIDAVADEHSVTWSSAPPIQIAPVRNRLNPPKN
jgi:hypothetical protein